MRIVDFLERDARIYGAKKAVIIDGGEELTYSELRERVVRFAGGLDALGVGRADRVAVLARNGLPFFDVYLSCAYLGAAAVPISTRLTREEIRYQLDNSLPTIVVADEAHADSVSGVLPPGTHLLRTDSDQYAAAICAPPRYELIERATTEDLALIIYTSGTTGQPKGACLTHRSLTANATSITIGQRMVHEDVFMTTTPLYHAGAAARVVANLIDGQTHVVLPEFSVENALDAIDRHRVSVFIAVPVQLRRMLDSAKIRDRNMDSLRMICYGAAPTAPGLIKTALSTLTCGLYQGYGQTEATSAVSGLLPSDHLDLQRLDTRLASCGRPLPGVDVRIVDEHMNECDVGEVGEICVRGDNMMAGYWNNDVATAEALRDGWLHTGDLARWDSDGYIYIVGRAKDMLISGGVNIYPSEVEAVLSAHPTVAEAAVVGEADDEWGEVPVAFVLPQAGTPIDISELRAFCEARLSRIKIPQRFEIVHDLPRTSTGKVRKFLLRMSLSTVQDGPRGE